MSDHKIPYNLPTLKIRPAVKSVRGFIRENNEDRAKIDREINLYMVSDGMGGQKSGEIAAEAVITLLPQALRKWLESTPQPSGSEIETALREKITSLSQQLREEADKQPHLKGMGATLALVWIIAGNAYIAHMGDSRVYLFRTGLLTQITDDHTFANALLKAGSISFEEARNHPGRNKLSMHVGGDKEQSPDIQSLPLENGDGLLICSDGLTSMVSDEKISAIMKANPDSGAACRSLVGTAEAAGGRDNITVLVINVEAG